MHGKEVSSLVKGVTVLPIPAWKITIEGQVEDICDKRRN